MFVHDPFFRYMHVPGQSTFKHELWNELTINLRSKLVETSIRLVQRKSGGNLKISHGIAVKKESLKGKLDGLVAMNSRSVRVMPFCGLESVVDANSKGARSNYTPLPVTILKTNISENF
jgi:hypothetical protein